VHIVLSAVHHPDLTIASLAAAIGATTADPVSINWSSVNQGDGNTVSGWTERVLVTNLTTGAVVRDSRVTVTSDLPAGGTRSGTLTFPRPGPGHYLVQVITDVDDQLFESNTSGHTSAEQNNTSQTEFTITGPDLVVSTISAPTNLIIGISSKVRGEARAAAGTNPSNIAVDAWAATLSSQPWGFTTTRRSNPGVHSV